MKITFVPTEERRDRVYVSRDDGSSVSWSFPSYRAFVPHDLAHYVIETDLGLTGGFWGLVAEGVDFGFPHDSTEGHDGDDAPVGAICPAEDDLMELRVAEAVVGGLTWLCLVDGWTDDECLDFISGACAKLGVSLPEQVDRAHVAELRDKLDTYARRWRELDAGEPFTVDYEAA